MVFLVTKARFRAYECCLTGNADELSLPFNYEAAGMQANGHDVAASCCGPNGHQNGVEINGRAAQEISTDSECDPLFTAGIRDRIH